MSFPRKILVSHGYGAGWSSWHGSSTKFVCEYQPIIEYLESGGVFKEKPYDSKLKGPDQFEEPGASVLRQFIADLAEHEGEAPSAYYFYLGGADDLVVETAHGPYRIHEYDGYESVTYQDSTEFID